MYQKTLLAHRGCCDEISIVKLGCFTCNGGNSLFGVEGKIEIPTTCYYRSAGSGYYQHTSFSRKEAKWDKSRAYTP